MKIKLFIICFINIYSLCFSQQNGRLINEIKTIENSLIPSIQFKGDSIQELSILERMEFYKVQGVSIAVVENRKIKWAKGYGYANTKTGAKVDANTLFQAASVSKPISALSALKLFENGNSELNKDVNYYLKDWQIPENRFTTIEKVTLEKLLTHTAGMTVNGFPGYQQTDEFPDTIDVLNGKGNTNKVVVDTIPGSIWRYSGGGYTVMEKVVEDVSKVSFDEYMFQNILLPIGMKNSTFQQPITNGWLNNISAGYDENGKIMKGLWHNNPQQAAGGLWTTATDLALYCIEIQDIIQGKKDGVLRKKTVEKMLTKHKNSWGLGPKLQGQKESLIFGHDGRNIGFTADMRAYAYQGNAIIILTNGDKGEKLIAEIRNAISKYYNWSLYNENMVIEIIKLSEILLNQYAGKYEIKDRDMMHEVEVKDNHLFLTNTPFGNISLVALTNSKFIHLESDTVFEFLVDKEVTGFMVNDIMKFVRIE